MPDHNQHVAFPPGVTCHVISSQDGPDGTSQFYPYNYIVLIEALFLSEFNAKTLI